MVSAGFATIRETHDFPLRITHCVEGDALRLRTSCFCSTFHPPILTSMDGSCLWQLLLWFSTSLVPSAFITWDSSIRKSSIFSLYVCSCVDSRICVVFFGSEFNAAVIYLFAQPLPTGALGSFFRWTPMPF